MRIAVTGATGRLGCHVVQTLHEAGHQILAVDRLPSTQLPTRVTLINLLDPLPLYDLLQGCQALVHLGNIPSLRPGILPQTVYQQNTAANANVFEAAAAAGIQTTIYASSVQAFRGWRTEDQPHQPSCLPHLPVDGSVVGQPANLYGLSKVAGENLLRYYAAVHPQRTFAALRFPFLTSEEKLARRFADASKNTKCIGYPDELFAYLTKQAAARLIQAILEKPKPGYHQLLPAARNNTRQLSPAQMIDRFFQNVPLKVPAAQMTSLIDLDPIRETFGWEG